MIQQNVQQAQGQLNELKNKLASLGTGSYGNSSGEIDMPEGFKGSQVKTKTFKQRLEYGANFQSQKASMYFPVTSDVGWFCGYKLSDYITAGVGNSLKIGFGSGWQNIKISYQGISLRCYIDGKLRGSIYLSAGYEQNYRNAFTSVQQLRNYSAWSTSGLLGISKKYALKAKLRGEFKLLWDYLSYSQKPRSQPILFRIGYALK